jgi:hypothetical protein
MTMMMMMMMIMMIVKDHKDSESVNIGRIRKRRMIFDVYL